MELDDFKKKDRKVKSFDKVNDHSSSERINNMIDSLKSYQKKQRKKVITMIISNFTLAAVYVAIMASRKGMEAIGYFILGMGLILAVLYLFFRYKPLSAVTYSLPINEFLERAERNISYLHPIDYFILIPLLGFLGTGGGIVFTTSLLRHTNNSTLLIIIWVIFFISLCVFGFWAGKKNWGKEYGEIHRKIMEMKNYYATDEDNLGINKSD